MEIPYGEQAALIDKPKAVRAIGLANGRNPVSIIVPCHRVIGKNGSLTGYGGGLGRKRLLLKLEGVAVFRDVDEGPDGISDDIRELHALAVDVSNGPGVAETLTRWFVISMNSSKRSGRLSIAEGSRKQLSPPLRWRAQSYGRATRWPEVCQPGVSAMRNPPATPDRDGNSPRLSRQCFGNSSWQMA